MDFFEFREKLVGDHETFTRSFTRIHADDIRAFVDEAYDLGRYWPAPLVQVNPNFKSGSTVEELVAQGGLHKECGRIFRAGKSASNPGTSLKLFKHQEEAISFAYSGESYVLTTGTGSGKSLSHYHALVTNEAAVRGLGDETLKKIAVELVQSLRKSVTVDWAVRETVRARLRVMVKTLLKRNKYPPDKQEEATETVLKQAESLSAEWVAV